MWYLLVASVVFFVLELLHPGVGLPAIAGVVCLVLGGLYLFDTSVPGVSVSPFVIVPVAIFAAVFFLIVVRAAMRLRHRGSTTRDEELVGLEGVVVSATSTPSGVGPGRLGDTGRPSRSAAPPQGRPRPGRRDGRIEAQGRTHRGAGNDGRPKGNEEGSQP